MHIGRRSERMRKHYRTRTFLSYKHIEQRNETRTASLYHTHEAQSSPPPGCAAAWRGSIVTRIAAVADTNRPRGSGLREGVRTVPALAAVNVELQVLLVIQIATPRGTAPRRGGIPARRGCPFPAHAVQSLQCIFLLAPSSGLGAATTSAAWGTYTALRAG